jgi:hypothetical protein
MDGDTSWLSKALCRITALATAQSACFTLKAARELSVLELDAEDAGDILSNLTVDDSEGRMKSHTTGKWMHIFKPQLPETVLYIKIVLRDTCVLISFHEDDVESDEEDA